MKGFTQLSYQDQIFNNMKMIYLDQYLMKQNLRCVMILDFLIIVTLCFILSKYDVKWKH